MYLESMDDSLIKNITLIANYNGIAFESTAPSPISGNTFESITATNNLNDAIISGVTPPATLTNNTFRGMILNNNGDSGIYLNKASNNTFTNITANENDKSGIVLINASTSNTVVDSEFCSNGLKDVECESAQQAGFTNNRCGSGNVCGGTCLPCGAGPGEAQFLIVAFSLEPNPAVIGSSEQITATVRVRNVGGTASAAKVSLSAEDLLGTEVPTGTSPATSNIGASSEWDFVFTFSVAGWDVGKNYPVTVSAFKESASEPDSKTTKTLTVLGTVKPVPELSVLLLPLLLAVILLVLRKK